MKKSHFLMALLTLFGASSPANAVESTVMHEDLAARVSEYWVVDHETSTVTNNRKLRQGRAFTADDLTTIFKDLRTYLRNPARNDYKINISENFLFGYQDTSIDFLPIARFIYSIGDGFMQGSFNLERLDMTGFVKLQTIGDRFVANATKLKIIVATELGSLKKIGDDCLAGTKSLEFIDTIWLVHVQTIGEAFMWNTALTSFDRTNLVSLVTVGTFFLFDTPFLRDMDKDNPKTYNKFIDKLKKLVERNKRSGPEDRRISAREIRLIKELPERRLVLDELILTYSKAEEKPNSKKIVVKPLVATQSGRLYYSPLIAGLTRHTSHKVQKGNAFKKLPHFILQIIDSYLRYDSVYAALCQNNGPQIRSFVSTHYRRVFRLREMPADFQAQLHDLVEKYKQTHPTYQPEPPRAPQPGTEEQKKEQENKEAEQQQRQRQNQEEETKEEPPRKPMLKQDGSANK